VANRPSLIRGEPVRSHDTVRDNLTASDLKQPFGAFANDSNMENRRQVSAETKQESKWRHSRSPIVLFAAATKWKGGGISPSHLSTPPSAISLSLFVCGRRLQFVVGVVVVGATSGLIAPATAPRLQLHCMCGMELDRVVAAVAALSIQLVLLGALGPAKGGFGNDSTLRSHPCSRFNVSPFKVGVAVGCQYRWQISRFRVLIFECGCRPSGCKRFFLCRLVLAVDRVCPFVFMLVNQFDSGQLICSRISSHWTTAIPGSCGWERSLASWLGTREHANAGIAGGVILSLRQLVHVASRIPESPLADCWPRPLLITLS